MTKDSLRNEIEQIQLELVEKTANPTTKWEDVIPEATSQILSLIEQSLPKEKQNGFRNKKFDNTSIEDCMDFSWNACLQEIRSKLQ